ncbi:hypothetical protein M2189_006609 [Bradyrhizobium japonicum]|uniref:hypothetical protein n=1 Tax=Bradyrhizobium japonicum TaxID=375 RepID=UPI00216A6262|nr:hypothetical protein [Bradyrhizobium japonicum]MCS3503874.1 hypothetical protein [Bradyrhizobium japonicum]MCS3963406.1 hypothetical protein [Bradyrhizobium japonicum]MCS3995719.1 hypothetical protein [Bradyrhizobium japonicum]
MNRHCTIALFGLASAILFQSSASFAADRVWFEKDAGSISTGYDVPGQRTRITDYFLQAVGPADIQKEFENEVARCAGYATTAAGGAFYSTPGEVGAKSGAAIGSFKATFLGCAFNLPSLIRDKYRMNIASRDRWERGWHVTGLMNDPTRDMIPKGTPPVVRDYLNKARGPFNIGSAGGSGSSGGGPNIPPAFVPGAPNLGPIGNTAARRVGTEAEKQWKKLGL